MYSTCLFCSGQLGTNTILPTFPVGRRLAFDPARGRLWVICEWCQRWNLSPLDERWEAVEECERRFRATRLRFSTANIGLAYVPLGLALVRIGPALKPEIAAWRYGRYLRRWLPAARWDPLRSLGNEAVALADRGVGWAAHRLGLRRRYDIATWLKLTVRPDRVLAMVPADAGGTLVVRVRHLGTTELKRPDPREPWQLWVAHDDGMATLSGDLGLAVAGKLLAALNGTDAPENVVRYAVQKLEDAANPDGYFARVATIALRCWWGRRPDATEEATGLVPASATDAERLALHLTKRSFWGRGGLGSEPMTALPQLPLVDRLALEMAAHEDGERRAMEGELALLELAWREAEEVAAIADSLPLEWPEPLLDGAPAPAPA